MSKLEDAIKEAMRVVKKHGALAKIKKEGRDTQQAAKDEAKKAGMSLDEYNDMYPNQWNCYLEFDDQGELENIVFDGESYYPGHGGRPLGMISVHPSVTLKEIEDEIGEALFNSGIFEEE